MTEIRTLIPAHLYMGIHGRAQSASPMAAITAWGTDAAAKKRMATVDSHSKDAVQIANEPLSGFKVVDVAWKDELRVQDPRGFSVSVKSKHVMELIKSCTMHKSEILEPCVWARRSGDNVLLNTQDASYAHAIMQTEVSNSKVAWSKAHMGNRVTLQNGVQGVYLGKMHALCVQESSSMIQKQENLIHAEPVAKHVVLESAVNRYTRAPQTTMHMSANLKLARVDSDVTCDVSQAECEVNEFLCDNTTWASGSYLTQVVACAHTPWRMDQIELQLAPHDPSRNSHSVKLWVQLSADQIGSVGATNKLNQTQIRMLDVHAFMRNELVYAGRLDRGYWNFEHKLVNLPTNITYHDLVIKTQTASGTPISYVI